MCNCCCAEKTGFLSTLSKLENLLVICVVLIGTVCYALAYNWLRVLYLVAEAVYFTGV